MNTEKKYLDNFKCYSFFCIYNIDKNIWTILSVIVSFCIYFDKKYLDDIDSFVYS